MNLATFGHTAPTLVCVDAKGHDIKVGYMVVDSFGELHTVAQIVPQSSRQAYLVDTEGKAMMPWLTELVQLVELVEGTL